MLADNGAVRKVRTWSDEVPEHSPWERLEAALDDGTGVYVPKGEDEVAYFLRLATSIRSHRCEPFTVHAAVMAPGFPDAELGDVIAGLCLAHRDGYWLVYQPEQDRFCCFWGSNPEMLGAHGVYGSPLYCWSA